MNNEVTTVNKCRLCGSTDLVHVLSLGNLKISGYFPKSISEDVISHPLELIKCNETNSTNCGLVQLKFNLDPSLLYGNSYGYRSGLNITMVNHLTDMSKYCQNFVKFKTDDRVVDIAGNDGTFLSNFSSRFDLISVDPLAEKFKTYYPKHIKRFNDFFGLRFVNAFLNDKKAKLVTSFSVFYDLQDPIDFLNAVHKILDPIDGVWVLEQSYLPSMMEMNSFDTICHEHLLYFGLKQFLFALKQAKMKIIDLDLTPTNGGSLRIVSALEGSSHQENSLKIEQMLRKERVILQNQNWINFQKNIYSIRKNLEDILQNEKNQGIKLAALGASTKGSILLQYFQINSNTIEVIGDVNEEKNGSFTAGSLIPIKAEDKVLKEYSTFLVLPWHFKNFFIQNPKFKGKKLIFPLPEPHIIQL